MIGRAALGVLLALAVGSVAAQERQVPGNAAEVQLSFAPIVRQVAPAVVNVYASRTVQRQVSPFFSDPFFRQFFGDPFGGRSQRVERSLGSGVVISPDGLVVTNHHVIEFADEVRVALGDRREFSASVLMKDERSDLAVLKLEGNVSGLPTIEYADSDAVEVGDLVLAIGDPFGVGQTVTSGIVSAFARVPGRQPGDDQYFIQTDAAINPGNSGGALVDMQGRLIGINRMIVSPSGGSSGVGFAIPSNLVKVVVGAAEGGGVARRPWLGADLQSLTADLASGLGLDAPSGVLVAEVDPAGPAYLAGLEAGDLIVAFDGELIDDLGALYYRLATKSIGAVAKLEVMRNGARYSAEVDMTAAPETVPRDERLIVGDSPFAGLTVVNLSPAVAEEMAYRGALEGVIVGGVLQGSNASRAGFSRGDIIAEVNGVRIDSTERLAGVAADMANRWNLVLRRAGRTMQFTFRG